MEAVKKSDVIQFGMITRQRHAGFHRILKCLLKQTDQRWFLNVINDGHDDIKRAMITEMLPEHQFSYTETPPSAVPGHLYREQVINYDIFTWFAALDDDDLISPLYIENVFHAIEKNKESLPDVIIFSMGQIYSMPGYGDKSDYHANKYRSRFTDALYDFNNLNIVNPDYYKGTYGFNIALSSYRHYGGIDGGSIVINTDFLKKCGGWKRTLGLHMLAGYNTVSNILNHNPKIYEIPDMLYMMIQDQERFPFVYQSTVTEYEKTCHSPSP